MNNTNDSDHCNTTADFQFYLFPIIYILAVSGGLLGNLRALYVFIFKIKQISPSNVYIINLAVADTIFLCSLPFRIHYHLNRNDWIFGDLACRITGSVYFANIYISIAFMTCICVDRYIATVHPHTYLRLRNTRCTVMVSAAIWTLTGSAMLAFILAGPFETIGSRHNGPIPRSCFENFSQDEWSKRLTPYSACSLVLGSLVPSLVILVCYPLVARRIARIRTGTARGALRLIYAILAITLLCFLPYHVVHLLHLLRRTQFIKHCTVADGIYKARRVTMAMVSLNSLLDPVLYFFATNHCKWQMPRFKKTKGVYTISGSL
ncbi:lysophosphatidic acid receptor 6 [Chanos chanos]|uniref:Lysophosphatidic acid receptor 6 n=1 Tax=Chanos chanos TaxID=29144 RepID=A0A6J2USU4_CHACN|nr:lysophosphatidic acid receptor 6-like [Chanos chanos]